MSIWRLAAEASPAMDGCGLVEIAQRIQDASSLDRGLQSSRDMPLGAEDAALGEMS